MAWISIFAICIQNSMFNRKYAGQHSVRLCTCCLNDVWSWCGVRCQRQPPLELKPLTLQPNKLKHKKLTWTRPAASKRQHCIIGRKIKFPCTGREFCNISRVMFAVSSDAHFYLHFYNRLYDFKFEIEWWRRPKWGRMRKMCKRQHIETETKKTQYFNAHERHTLGNTQCFQHRRSFSDATILYPRKKNAWKNWVEMIK